MRNEDSLTTILLVSRLCAQGVRPLKASEYWSLLDRIGVGPLLGGDRAEGASPAKGVEAQAVEGLSPVLGQSEQQLMHDCGLPEDLAGRIAGLVERATAVAFELDRLEQSGINTVTAFDEHYPPEWLARLGAKAPPVVHGAGSLDLLDTPGLGVVGSRDVSAAGGEVAKHVGRLAARRGLPLVSGGARGVDQLAMDPEQQPLFAETMPG